MHNLHKAAISQLVLYKGQVPGDDPKDYAAVITAVKNTDVVDLVIFTPQGDWFKRDLCYGDELDSWRWPPKLEPKPLKLEAVSDDVGGENGEPSGSGDPDPTEDQDCASSPGGSV